MSFDVLSVELRTKTSYLFVKRFTFVSDIKKHRVSNIFSTEQILGWIFFGRIFFGLNLFWTDQILYGPISGWTKFELNIFSNELYFGLSKLCTGHILSKQISFWANFGLNKLLALGDFLLSIFLADQIMVENSLGRANNIRLNNWWSQY